MKSFTNASFSLTLLFFFGFAPVYSQSIEAEIFRPWVEYRNGEVSVTFRRVPVEFALRALQEATGLQIILPTEAQGKTLDLSLRGLPLESVTRLLLSSIGFRSYALTYDRNGRPLRAIGLEAQPKSAGAATPAGGPAAEPRELTAEEQEKLNESLALWGELKSEERGRIEDRLRSLPPSDGREVLLQQYARRVLGISD